MSMNGDQMPDPTVFEGVTHALEYLGLDLAQGISDPRVAELTDRLFAAAAENQELEEQIKREIYKRGGYHDN